MTARSVSKMPLPKTPGFLPLERVLEEYGEDGVRFAVEKCRRQVFQFGPTLREVRFSIEDVEKALVEDVTKRLALPPVDNKEKRLRRDQAILDAVREKLREEGF